MPVVNSRCPAAPTFPADPTRPTPETLRYSLTLPAALASPAMARVATTAFLRAHDLADMMDPGLQAVSELTATACQFTESLDFYLALRYRSDTLRVIVYRQSPPPHPTEPRRVRHPPPSCPTGPGLRLPGLRRGLGLRRVPRTGRRDAHVGDVATRDGSEVRADGTEADSAVDGLDLLNDDDRSAPNLR